MRLTDEERQAAIQALQEHIAGILDGSREDKIQSFIATGHLKPEDVEEYRQFTRDKVVVYNRLLEHLKHEEAEQKIDVEVILSAMERGDCTGCPDFVALLKAWQVKRETCAEIVETIKTWMIVHQCGARSTPGYVPVDKLTTLLDDLAGGKMSDDHTEKFVRSLGEMTHKNHDQIMLLSLIASVLITVLMGAFAVWKKGVFQITAAQICAVNSGIVIALYFHTKIQRRVIKQWPELITLNAAQLRIKEYCGAQITCDDCDIRLCCPVYSDDSPLEWKVEE